MTRFKKHEDSLDIQLVTKFFDQNGNELAGVIEYDPSSGYGKRFKIDADPKSALVEEFFCGNGHMQIDGNTFDRENYDDDEIDAIKTVIKMKVNRNKDPKTYEDLVNKLTDDNRKKKPKENPPPGPPQQPSPTQPSNIYNIQDAARQARLKANEQIPKPTKRSQQQQQQQQAA